MKKTVYIISGYTLSLLLCLSFFFTLFYVYQINHLIGAGISIGLLLITAILLTDPEGLGEVMEMEEVS